MTHRIEILRGIRQGCPISPKLFILCTQMLAYLVVNYPQLEGITFSDYEYRIKIIKSISVKSEVKYLGLMSKELHTRELVNKEERIDITKKSLNHWLMRELSIMAEPLD
ncbi:putative mitochondrial protein [Labeo rohita]|uniref:Mitochondrial protein n=1 Tax=Labeo rohita TaxID=84645 RepID=A0ABQ8MM96_LABRO|nr:putative mitochondrial protein [Labeo rohita]